MNDSTPSAPVTIAQSVSPLASPDSLIEQFGAIINAKLETSNKATNATLARIEDNTSILKKLSSLDLRPGRSPPRDRSRGPHR